MARKFVTLNHHSADDPFNPDVAWDKINKFYIERYNYHNFRHASLSTGHFLAYFWKHGNREWGGDLDGIGELELNIFKNYLRNGGGHVFYGMGAPRQCNVHLSQRRHLHARTNPKISNYYTSISSELRPKVIQNDHPPKPLLCYNRG